MLALYSPSFSSTSWLNVKYGMLPKTGECEKYSLAYKLSAAIFSSTPTTVRSGGGKGERIEVHRLACSLAFISLLSPIAVLLACLTQASAGKISEECCDD